ARELSDRALAWQRSAGVQRRLVGFEMTANGIARHRYAIHDAVRKVIQVNTMLHDSPERVNASPYQDGWMVQIVVGSSDETKSLLDPPSYRTFPHERAD